MSFFPFFNRKRKFFSHTEEEQILAAIREAEKTTSGEIRLFIESKCRMVNPVHRAEELFFALKMDHTRYRNGILIYIAFDHHQLAIVGDSGIHEKVGDVFWNQLVQHLIAEFRQQHFAEALVTVISDLGRALSTHFPYEPGIDKNELPDDILFGR